MTGVRRFEVLVFTLVLMVLAGVLLPVPQPVEATQAEGLPPLIDREVFFGDPQISGAQLSPDGDFISFIKPYRGARNIYVKRLEEPFEAARPVTADERPVPGYFWSQDGRFVLYVQDRKGDENFHVYAVDPRAEAEAATGVPPARNLTPIEGVRALIYAVPKNRPAEILVGLNDRDPAYHDVYSVDLASGERRLLIENTQGVASFSFDLDGQVRLAVRQMPDGGTEILRVEGEELIQVYACGFEESCFPTRFHKDGRRVYLNTNRGEAVDLSRLVLLDPVSLQEEIVESDPEGEVDFGGALFAQDTDELAATVYVGDRVRIYPQDERFRRDLALLKERLPEGELSFASATLDMRLQLVAVTRDVDSGSVYLYDRKSGRVDLLYRSRPDLPSEHLAPMQAIRYRARDGLEIPAYLTLPKGVEAKNLSTVIVPHGGPWARDTWGYDSFAQFLANRGYAVLQPNFRGSAGYGKQFLNAGNREWGIGAMQHDITDGVKHVVEQGIADPKRVAIFGGSYGGYATLAGVTFTPELYAAGVPYVAPSNLITLIESFPAYWGPFMKIWHLRVGNPADEKDRADLVARSPLFKAENIRVPLLVVHGLNDPRVKKSESDQIVVALRERGLPVEYLVAPDEGHGFRAPENRLALAAKLEEFLAQHLGGRFQEDRSEVVEKTLAALTVDVSGVTVPDETRAAYAETAPLPPREAQRIRPLRLSYDAVMEVGGQQLAVQLERTVTAGDLDGVPVWKIESHSRSALGQSSDVVHLDRETLLPLRKSAVQGPAAVDLAYHPDAVRGRLSMGTQEIPVDVPLAAPVLGDGAALEVILAALPLTQEYESTLRVFDLVSRKTRPMAVKVTGREKLEVKAGLFDAFRVEIEPLDGQPGGGTYSIAGDEPHVLVRSTTRLPPEMGGGTVTLELSAIEK